MKLPQLPQDKANHFVYGVMMYLVGSLATGPVLALALVGVAAALKEIIDAQGFGTPELADFVATVAGGFSGFTCSYF